MSIKLFAKGLGLFEHPFDSYSNTKLQLTTPVVDTTTLNNSPPVNNQQITDALEVKPQSTSTGLFTTAQIAVDDIRKNFSIKPVARPIMKLNITPQLYSAPSAPAPFETLYHDFNLEAYPFYNFWTSDEMTNDRDELGKRKLEDVPRFIKLAWNPAPDLPDPEIRLAPRNVDIRKINPVLINQENVRPSVHIQKGVSFTPDHLQATGFSNIKGIMANGYLAPGVLETIVEMPLNNTGLETPSVFSQPDPIHHLDEDVFLTHPDLQGISIHELQAQILQRTDGIANMSTPTPQAISSNLADKKQNLVDSKYMLTTPLMPGGFARVTSIQSSSPSVSFNTRTAQSMKTVVVDNVIEMANKLVQSENNTTIEQSAQVKVKFINPAIAGLINQDKINLLDSPHQVEALVAVAPMLPNLEILSRTDLRDSFRHYNPPSLPSPKVKPLEYIGYIIEKYKRQASGAFIKIDEIDIPVRDADSYIDSKVLYGEVYRYRIKAVLRWTRNANMNIAGFDQRVEEKFGSQTAPSANYKSSYLTSEWSHTWAYGSCLDNHPPAHPDELTVRPESLRKRIVITFKLPDNPERDIIQMRLYRKLQDLDTGVDLTGWNQVVASDSVDRGVDFAPQNVIFFDNNVSEKYKYVYAAQCTGIHGEDSTLSEQIAARLNNKVTSMGEYPVQFVSCAGVRLDYFGAFSVSPPHITKTEIIIQPPSTPIGKSPGIAEIVISGRDTLGNTMLENGEYVCRVQSLDTGEVKDIPITVNFKNIQIREEIAEYDFYVPTHSATGKNSNNFKRVQANDGFSSLTATKKDENTLPRLPSAPRTRF